MPTIDDLPQASASADTDELICNQGGVRRKATRAQLLASSQPLLALGAGQLLGRTDSGTGAPQPINVGAGLALTGGTLINTAPFAIATLPAAMAPLPTDVVPLAQTGQNAGASYAQFMSGLAGVSGIGANTMTVRATGATATRLLDDRFADALAVEDFGAAGDGVTDDTLALAAALSAGQPVRLGPKTYMVGGQWTISGNSAVLLGVPGQTTLKRITQTGNGAWISVQSKTFRARGITFDANAGISTDSWGVLVTPSCLSADLDSCAFTNARGATQGSGLTFQAADPVVTQHLVRGCEASGNALHGIWVQALQNVHIALCRAHDNGQYGVCIDYADPTFVRKLHSCQITGCTTWNNQRGISVGNFNSTNTTPAVWGNANPDAVAILVSDNLCHNNTVYGIAASGRALNISQNQLADNGVSGGAGLLANVAYTRVSGNVITGASFYGIDAGGSIVSDIVANHISGATHGINPGGGQNVRVAGNYIQDCTGWSILVNNVETDGNSGNFGMACSGLTISDNWIGFSIAGGGGGILLLDNPQNVSVMRNCVVGSGGATIGQALWANSNSVTIEANTWNFSPRAIVASTVIAGGSQLAYPDLLDSVLVTACTNPVLSLLSQRQQALSGQLGFIALTAGGSGYTSATVSVTGNGTGATAIAYVSNGAVIGIALTNAGSGYSTATASIAGTGTGATASPQIGLPLLEQRALMVCFTVPVVFAQAGSSPLQQNWTGFAATVPAFSKLAFSAHAGTWRAGVLPLADYIAPDGTGGNTLITQNGGDLVLKPSGGGHLRMASSTEATGVTTSIGRGAPAGAVAATPGSDYRNLNGGAGATYWIKQTGTGTSGWVAVA